MADYPIESQLVLSLSGQPLPGGKVYVYDSDDTGNTTLLALTDPNGLPVTNPLTASGISITPEFRSPVALVKMVGEDGSALTVLSAKGVVEQANAAVDEANAAKTWVQGFTVGTVAAGDTPAATVTPDGKLNLTLAKGDKGDKGDTGPMGPGGVPVIEDPDDPGFFLHGTNIVEDPDDPGFFLIGA